MARSIRCFIGKIEIGFLFEEIENELIFHLVLWPLSILVFVGYVSGRLGAYIFSRRAKKNTLLINQIKTIVNSLLIAGFYISFTHVRGHTGNEWNEYVDSLAKLAARGE